MATAVLVTVVVVVLLVGVVIAVVTVQVAKGHGNVVPSDLWPLFLARSASVKPKIDVVQFLQQLGYPQYTVPLASCGFARMKELCLINAFGLKKCGILDGHALQMLLK